MQDDHTYIALPLAESYPAYSRAERLADATLHVAGVAAALAAVPVVVTLTVVWYGDRTTVTAAIVYGLGLIAMLAFSASYHLVSHPHAKAILRRFDHAAIYVKIAATYTLFAILLARPQAASILSPIWTAAAVGLALKLAAPRRLERVSLALYLTMGWAIVIIGGPILDGLSAAGLLLVLAGGGVYTVGVIFLLWERLKFHNAIWHGLVLAASVLLYAAVLVEVAGHAPIA